MELTNRADVGERDVGVEKKGTRCPLVREKTTDLHELALLETMTGESMLRLLPGRKRPRVSPLPSRKGGRMQSPRPCPRIHARPCNLSEGETMSSRATRT